MKSVVLVFVVIAAFGVGRYSKSTYSSGPTKEPSISSSDAGVRAEGMRVNNPNEDADVGTLAMGLLEKSSDVNFWQRRLAILTLISISTHSHVPLLVEILEKGKTMPGFLNDSEVELTNRKIGELAGVDALANFSLEVPLSSELKARMVGFAAASPAAAKAWYESLPDSGRLGSVAARLVEGLVENDAVTAIAFVKGLEPKGKMLSAYPLLDGLFQSMSPDHVIKAAEEIMKAPVIPTPAHSQAYHDLAKSQFGARLIERLASTHPAVAKTWLEQNKDSTLFNPEMLGGYAEGASATGKTEEMLDWALTLRTPGNKAKVDTGLLGMARSIAPNDLDALGKWVNNHPNIERIEDLAAIMASESAKIDPEAGLAWKNFAEAKNSEITTARGVELNKAWLRSRAGLGPKNSTTKQDP